MASIPASDGPVPAFHLFDHGFVARIRAWEKPDSVADGDHVAAVDRHRLKHAANVAGMGLAVVALDDRDQAVNADNSAWPASREVDREIRSTVVLTASIAVAQRLVGVVDDGHDGPMPRQIPLRANALGAFGVGLCEAVLPVFAGQVVGPRPFLTVLSERDPDFLLLRHAQPPSRSMPQAIQSLTPKRFR